MRKEEKLKNSSYFFIALLEIALLGFLESYHLIMIYFLTNHCILLFHAWNIALLGEIERIQHYRASLYAPHSLPSKTPKYQSSTFDEHDYPMLKLLFFQYLLKV